MQQTEQRSGSRMNIFTIAVPTGAESTFLRTMSRNMGWDVTVSRPKNKADKTSMSKEEFFGKINRAKQQVENGEVGPVFNSSEDLFDYIETLAK